MRFTRQMIFFSSFKLSFQHASCDTTTARIDRQPSYHQSNRLLFFFGANRKEEEEEQEKKRKMMRNYEI
jgi:hypothetical protein